MMRVAVSAVLSVVLFLTMLPCQAEEKSDQSLFFNRAVDECRSYEASHDKSPFLVEMNDAVCFKGRIARGDDEKIIRTLQYKSKPLVINSIGGDGISAINLGKFILKQRIPVATYDACLSACANYVLLAGSKKYVANRTLVAWHGAPNHEPTISEIATDKRGQLQQLYRLSEDFFDAAGFDRDLTMRPDPHMPGYGAWRRRWTNEPRYFWAWTPTSLETRFSVKNITYYWHPKDVNEIIEIGQQLGIDVLPEQN